MIADISPDAPLIYLAGWAPRSNGPTRGVIHTRKRSERNKSVIRGATCLAANSRGYRRGRKYQNTARNAKAQEPNAFTYKSTGMSSRSKRPSSASMTRRTYPSTSSIPFFRASSAKYSRRLSICSPASARRSCCLVIPRPCTNSYRILPFAFRQMNFAVAIVQRRLDRIYSFKQHTLSIVGRTQSTSAKELLDSCSLMIALRVGKIRCSSRRPINLK